MPTFTDYLKTDLSFFAATLFLTTFGGGLLWLYGMVDRPMMFTFGAALGSLLVWFGIAMIRMGSDWVAAKQRKAWETSMLTAMQLATTADTYYAGDADALSSFHTLVHHRKLEGKKAGYL